MNIALIGYGKMGQAIEEVAVRRGHTILQRFTSASKQDMDEAHLHNVDVAIEFTRPECALENVTKCFEAGINVVCGTTGWNDQLELANKQAEANKTGFLQASNFSIGVNIFFEINKLLAYMMNGHEEYNVAIEETHHIHKKDAPSGTAITLAQQIINNLNGKDRWDLGGSGIASSIPVIAQRTDNVPGTHKISYSSVTDDIEIIHTAHNRDGFALGAVLAAEFLMGKRGIFTMKDVLGFK